MYKLQSNQSLLSSPLIMLPLIRRALLTFLLCQWPGYADSKCCQQKVILVLILLILSYLNILVHSNFLQVVPGVSGKAGTYNLVSNSEPAPDFCLGGCVYTKEDDPPGNNYCFQEGEGTATCRYARYLDLRLFRHLLISGGGCGGGDVEGWIEKYFEKQCSMQSKQMCSMKIIIILLSHIFSKQCVDGQRG